MSGHKGRCVLGPVSCKSQSGAAVWSAPASCAHMPTISQICLQPGSNNKRTPEGLCCSLWKLEYSMFQFHFMPLYLSAVKALFLRKLYQFSQNNDRYITLNLLKTSRAHKWKLSEESIEQNYVEQMHSELRTVVDNRPADSNGFWVLKCKMDFQLHYASNAVYSKQTNILLTWILLMSSKCMRLFTVQRITLNAILKSHSNSLHTKIFCWK